MLSFTSLPSTGNLDVVGVFEDRIGSRRLLMPLAIVTRAAQHVDAPARLFIFQEF